MAILLATGCGGGDDSDDPATASSDGTVTVDTGSLSKAQFVKQAKAICQKSYEEFQADAAVILKRLNSDPTKAAKGNPEAELVEKAFVPNYQSQVDKVSALGAPSGDEEDVTEILESLQQAIDSAREDPDAFVANEGDLGEAPKLAKTYGLVTCAHL